MHPLFYNILTLIQCHGFFLPLPSQLQLQLPLQTSPLLRERCCNRNIHLDHMSMNMSMSMSMNMNMRLDTSMSMSMSSRKTSCLELESVSNATATVDVDADADASEEASIDRELRLFFSNGSGSGSANANGIEDGTETETKTDTKPETTFGIARHIVATFLSSRVNVGGKGKGKGEDKDEDDSIISGPSSLLIRRYPCQEDSSATVSAPDLATAELFAPLYAIATTTATTTTNPSPTPSPSLDSGEMELKLKLKSKLEQQERNMIQKQRRTSRHRHQSFKLHIAYRGESFCGWQIQPNYDALPSVQQTLIDRLDPILNHHHYNNHHHDNDNNNHKKMKKKMREKEHKSKHKFKPIDIRVCGRTDAGVSALGQVCRVRTLRSEDDVGIAQIMGAINQLQVQKQSASRCNGQNDPKNGNGNENGSNDDDDDDDPNHSIPIPSLCCTNVEKVTDKFHPTFDATCRAYAYLIDAKPMQRYMSEFCARTCTCTNNDKCELPHASSLSFTSSSSLPLLDMERIVDVMNAMLQKLEGVELDYVALSFGKVKTSTTLCTLSRCRACLVETNTTSQSQRSSQSNSESQDDYDNEGGGGGEKAICLELVGDRFLRRMVRILVATVVRETTAVLLQETEATVKAKTGSQTTTTMLLEQEEYEHRILDIIQSGRRDASAKAAPPHGLLFVGASFSTSTSSSSSV